MISKAINCRRFGRANRGGFGEGFAELVKRRASSEKPIPIQIGKSRDKPLVSQLLCLI